MSQPGIPSRAKASLVNNELSEISSKKRGWGSSRMIELVKRRRRALYSVFAVSVLVFVDVPKDSALKDGISRVKKLTRF